jgi:3-hydroxyisobutyrate dehydrogenase
VSSPARETIGFLGLGQMGQPMARRLVEAGHSVRAFDLSGPARAGFVAGGGAEAASPAEACDGASLVITMLPNGKIVRQALLEPNALGGAQPGALVIDMSSSAPLQTRALGVELEALGHSLIDAPVSGGVKRAVAGMLAIMAGGEPAAIDRARPTLRVFGQSIFVVGPLGAGHAMKALNNYVSAAGLAAACEAVIVGRSFGLDPETIVDILNVSTGKNNSTDVKMKPFVLSGTFGSGFSMALMAKDIETAADLSKSLGASAVGIAAAARLWRKASDASAPGTDHTAIFNYLALRATTHED